MKRFADHELETAINRVRAHKRQEPMPRIGPETRLREDGETGRREDGETVRREDGKTGKLGETGG